MINLLDNFEILKKIEQKFGILFQGQKFDPDPRSSTFGENDYFVDENLRYGTLKHQCSDHVLTVKCSGSEICYMFKLNKLNNGKFKSNCMT
jgi:hypothetical protein